MKWQSTLLIIGAIASQAFAGSDTIKCTINQEYARENRVYEGIDYLNGLSGQPIAQSGKCNRVSCAYGAGIYLCADDGKDHQLRSWGSVGDATKKLADKCISGDTINGRIYNSDGWSVIVQGSRC